MRIVAKQGYREARKLKRCGLHCEVIVDEIETRVEREREREIGHGLQDNNSVVNG